MCDQRCDCQNWYDLSVGLETSLHEPLPPSLLPPVSWYQHIPVSLKPYRLYPILAVSYVGAMVASNSALAYITYPTQVS